MPHRQAASLPPEDLAAQVFREQMRLAFELLPGAIIANTVLTVAVFVVLVQVTPPVEVAAWALAMLLLIAVRALAVWRYRRTPDEQRDYRLYARWYFIPYAFTGLGWAVLATFVVPAEPEIYPVLAMCAVFGLAAGGVAFLGHIRELYGIYLLATLLPAAAKWLANWWQFGGDFRLVMGVTTLVFIALLYSASHQLSRLVASAVAARLEKEALAGRLQELVATVERANHAKGEFIARMSRQIHAPAQLIAGQTQALLQAAPGVDVAAQQEVLRGLHEGAQSLLGMLGDVLDYSSLEAGRLPIENASFELRSLLAQTVAGPQAQARAQGLAFTLDIAADVPVWVYSDARRLAQILANLLANALHFTDSGSIALEVRRVSAGAQGAQNTLAFAVRDTGIGIPAQRLGGIFQPYVNVEGAAGQGSGLGLAISRRLAGLMQGAIAVQSEPGRGSVFTLMLAVGEADPAAPAHAGGTA